MGLCPTYKVYWDFVSYRFQSISIIESRSSLQWTDRIDFHGFFLMAPCSQKQAVRRRLVAVQGTASPYTGSHVSWKGQGFALTGALTLIMDLPFRTVLLPKVPSIDSGRTYALPCYSTQQRLSQELAAFPEMCTIMGPIGLTMFLTSRK